MCTVCAYVYSVCINVQCVRMFTVCAYVYRCMSMHMFRYTYISMAYLPTYVHTYLHMYIRRCTETRYPCTLGGPYRQGPLHIITYVRNSGLVTQRVIQQDTTARSLYKDLLFFLDHYPHTIVGGLYRQVLLYNNSHLHTV